MTILSLPQPVAISPQHIHTESLPGYIHLKVADLENRVLFYQQAIGLQLIWRKDKNAGLGVSGRDLVRMTEIQNDSASTTGELRAASARAWSQHGLIIITSTTKTGMGKERRRLKMPWACSISSSIFPTPRNWNAWMACWKKKA